jgi:hypothetical protein
MKTGYVYIVALNGRFGRVLRLCTSLRTPAERLQRLNQVGGRRRAPKLIGYEFVEDIGGAQAELQSALRSTRLSDASRSFRCSVAQARAALRRMAARQAAIRKARFQPATGLLVDPEIELGGPVTQFSETLADLLAKEAGGDLGKLPVFLHPYMVGTIATMFREKQVETKIPDEYLPEILRDIAWRLWRCRLKPGIFIRMAQRTRREQSYLDLARYSFEHRERAKPSARSVVGFGADGAQLTQFMQAPAAHLGQTMRSYADALERAPAVKLRTLLFRLAQIVLLIVGVFALDAILTSGSEPGRWLSALTLVFVAGVGALAFNLYDKPDLTRGLGILTRKEVETELKAIEKGGLKGS